MQDKSDAQLLREYARQGNEVAFREIVQRHTDLIYSAALRQVASPAVAGDVTQSVFTDLARKAPSLADSFTENSSILGWLYRSTRFAVLTCLRDERRRREREREAMDLLAVTPESPEHWDSLCPVLDEAMAELSDHEREAILLRYFKDQNFQSIGATLGVSDDTAQKRVSRAIEKLRVQLTRRGVAMSVSALSTMLAANAVQAAPIGLSAAISSAALIAGTLQTAGTVTTGKILFMTAAQKVLVATTLVVAMGIGIYQNYEVAHMREEVQSLAIKLSASNLMGAKRQGEMEEMKSRLSLAEQESERLRLQNGEIHKLRGEISRLRKDSGELAQMKADNVSDPTMSEAIAWKQRVQSLKQHLQDNPQAGIPELQLATEKDWLAAARNGLENEKDFRQAMASLREGVQSRFSSTLFDAVLKFEGANGNTFPSDVSQLLPYFNPPVDAALLERYAILPSTDAINSRLNMGGSSVLTQKSAVDEEYDPRSRIGPNGLVYSSGRHAWDDSLLSASARENAMKSLQPAIDAYMAANPGTKASRNALLPYVKTPEQREAFERLESDSGKWVPKEYGAK